MTTIDRLLIFMALGMLVGHSLAMANVQRNAAWDAHAARNEIAALKKDVKEMKDALNAVIQVPQ